MAYTKQTFSTGDTLTADHMNHIEAGIEGAHTIADEAKTAAAEKQDKLVSGTNIKTINGQSLLGEGDLVVEGGEGGGTSVSVVVDDALNENSTNPVQNKVVKAELDKKQATLVSGSNIKTLNGQSLLGSGNIEVDCSEYLEEVGVAIEADDDIAWGVRDSNGNFAVKIDNDGTVNVGKIKATKLVTDGKSTDSWLTGKKCFVLGDSLSSDTSATGSWHQKFCELTGAVLDPDLNRGWFSIGGTATIGTHTDKDACCQMRAKRLVEYYNEGNDVDVIFIQNVNDINNNRFSAGINSKGANTDLPFFENQVITYTSHVVEATTASTDVIAYFKENFSTIIEGITPMTGTVIDMLYTLGTTGAKELTITSTPTADGDITITMKHGANYKDDVFSVAVKAGMTKEEVVAAICEWQFQGVAYYDDVEGANGDSVIFSSPYSLVFDGGTTGVTATVTDTGTVNRYPIAFKSLDVSTFETVDNWGYESSVSYWSAQKGLIEYLQKNIPTAKIFYLILPYYKVTYPAAEGSAYLREDGTFNMEYWVEKGRGSSSAQVLYAEQPLVANYYGCSFIDVVNNCAISPINIETYYPSNNVHPSTAGYNAWGETVARILTGK